jgi:hypothetical protein
MSWNSEAGEVDGQRCYAHGAEFAPPMDAALLLFASAAPREPAVAGECPFLFLPAAAWIHRLHGSAAN